MPVNAVIMDADSTEDVGVITLIPINERAFKSSLNRTNKTEMPQVRSQISYWYPQVHRKKLRKLRAQRGVTQKQVVKPLVSLTTRSTAMRITRLDPRMIHCRD